MSSDLDRDLTRFHELAQERTAIGRRRRDHSTTSKAWERLNRQDAALGRELLDLGDRIREHGVDPNDRRR